MNENKETKDEQNKNNIYHKKEKINLSKKIITEQRKFKWNRKEIDKQIVYKMLKEDKSIERERRKENGKQTKRRIAKLKRKSHEIQREWE